MSNFYSFSRRDRFGSSQSGPPGFKRKFKRGRGLERRFCLLGELRAYVHYLPLRLHEAAVPDQFRQVFCQLSRYCTFLSERIVRLSSSLFNLLAFLLLVADPFQSRVIPVPKVKTAAVKRAAPPTEFHFHISGGNNHFNWNEGGYVPESRFFASALIIHFGQLILLCEPFFCIGRLVKRARREKDYANSKVAKKRTR